MASVRRDSLGDSKLEVSGLGNPSGGVTVMGWAKKVASGQGSWDTIISVDRDSTASYQYISWNNGANHVQYDEGGISGTYFDRPMQFGVWYFFCFVGNSANITAIYWKEDGDPGLTVETVSPTGNGFDSAMTHLQIFDSPWGGEWWNGSVTGVKYWLRELTQTEVEAEMNQRAAADPANLEGEWNLDGIGDWLDQSGNGNDLTGGAGLTTDPDEPTDLAGVAPPVELGTATGDGVGSGTATGDVLYGFSATGDGEGIGTGTLELIYVDLGSADGTGVGSGSGTLDIPPLEFEASGQGVGSGSGTFDVFYDLVADGNGKGTGIGTFEGVNAMVATGTGVGSGSGTLVISDTDMVATGTGVGSGTATGAILFEYTATGTGVGTGTGTLGTIGEFVATGTGVGVGSGQMQPEMQAVGLGLGYGQATLSGMGVVDSTFRLRRSDLGSTLRGGDLLQGAISFCVNGLGVGIGQGTMSLASWDFVATGIGVGSGRVETQLVVTILNPPDSTEVSGIVEVRVQVLPYQEMVGVTLAIDNELPLIIMDRTSGPQGFLWTYDWDTDLYVGLIQLTATALQNVGTLGNRLLGRDLAGGESYSDPSWKDSVLVSKVAADMVASGTGIGSGSGSMFGVIELGTATGIGVGTGIGIMFAVVIMTPATGVGIGTGTVLVPVLYRRGWGVVVGRPDTVIPDTDDPSVDVEGPRSIDPDQELVLVDVADE